MRMPEQQSYHRAKKRGKTEDPQVPPARPPPQTGALRRLDRRHPPGPGLYLTGSLDCLSGFTRKKARHESNLKMMEGGSK